MKDGNWEAVVMDSDGSKTKTTSNHPDYDGWPVWSPDGSQTAFARYVWFPDEAWYEASEIYVVDLDVID